MKKLFLFALLLSISFVNADEIKLGKEITLKEKTSLSVILANPAKFEGKTVLVEGTIADVCQEMGCWIDLTGIKEGEKIRVKVEDGEIVFPKDGKGKNVLVEGVVSKVESKTEMKHEDKKEGEHDSCETKAVYQIKGLGAVIK